MSYRSEHARGSQAEKDVRSDYTVRGGESGGKGKRISSDGRFSL